MFGFGRARKVSQSPAELGGLRPGGNLSGSAGPPASSAACPPFREDGFVRFVGAETLPEAGEAFALCKAGQSPNRHGSYQGRGMPQAGKSAIGERRVA